MAQILIIDDDPTVRSFLTSVAETVGHSILTAEDGRSGVRAFEAAPIGLVITDIVMPEQEGIATIGAIRRLDPLVPILAISGSDTLGGPGDYLRAANILGANETLPKPIDVDAFLDVMARLLRAEDEPYPRDDLSL